MTSCGDFSPLLSATRLQAALKHAPIMVFVADTGGTLVAANCRVLEHTGYTFDELRAIRLAGFVHPDDLALAERGAREVLSGDRPVAHFECRCRRKDGSVFWGNASLTAVDADGQSSRLVLAVMIDVTPAHDLADRLSAVNAQIGSILEGIHEAFFALDSEMRVTYINHAAEQLFDCRADEVIGRLAFEELLPQAKGTIFEQEYTAALAEKKPRRFEAFFDVEPFADWYDVRISPTAEGILVFLQVTTERRFLEAERRAVQQQLVDWERSLKQLAQEELDLLREKLVRQTQLATIGQLTASMAHELRNPLAVVRNTAYVLKRKLAQGDASKAAEYIEMIEQEMISADRIIKELVATTRGEPARRQSVQLRDVIDAARTRLAHHDKLVWQLEIPELTLDVDPEQFAQVFSNLFLNASRATSGTGTIMVRVEQSPEVVEIYVADDGPGISAENLERVFEPLFTGRARGTGLGLTICRQIVERHGGTIRALEHDGGAILRIRLPRQVS